METIFILIAISLISIILFFNVNGIKFYFSKRKALNLIKQGKRPTLSGIGISPNDFRILRSYVKDEGYLLILKNKVSWYERDCLTFNLGIHQYFRNRNDIRLRKWCIQQASKTDVKNCCDCDTGSTYSTEVGFISLAEKYYLFISEHITYLTDEEKVAIWPNKATHNA